MPNIIIFFTVVIMPLAAYFSVTDVSYADSDVTTAVKSFINIGH